MIEKFATLTGSGAREFLDLNRTSKPMILVSLMAAKFAPSPAGTSCELCNRDTRARATV
jgi:hypothetical protein